MTCSLRGCSVRLRSRLMAARPIWLDLGHFCGSDPSCRDAKSSRAPSKRDAERRPPRLLLWISCGWRPRDLRREPRQGFSRVQIGIVQYPIEQRSEDFTHTLAGRNPRDRHHFLAPDREVSHLERAGAAQLGLEAGLDLLLVRQTLGNQASA